MGKQTRLNMEKTSPAQKLIAATKRPDAAAVAELVEAYKKLVLDHQATLDELAAVKAEFAAAKIELTAFKNALASLNDPATAKAFLKRLKDTHA